MFVACGIWCLADVSSVSPVCSDEGHQVLASPCKLYIKISFSWKQVDICIWKYAQNIHHFNCTNFLFSRALLHFAACTEYNKSRVVTDIILIKCSMFRPLFVVSVVNICITFK